jgi:hypothetical protein
MTATQQTVSWRVRLNHDRSAQAAAARAAYNSMTLCEPSYYDQSGHEAYELSREQAAEALWAWRTAA